MNEKFKREYLYALTLFFTIILIIYNLFKNSGKEIFPVVLGSLLGIVSFEGTYHLVYSLKGETKKVKIKAAIFFFLFLLICTLILFFSKSIFYSILGYTCFVVSLLTMVFREIFYA